MELIIEAKGSKVAARIKRYEKKILKYIKVTVSEHAPESIQLTHSLPRTKGWRIVSVIPLRENGRKDYIKFLNETGEKEIWIKVSTSGGRSRIYVR
jgi:hypothetical protein